MAGLKDKVVLITGASSGIGEATAKYLAGLGAKLSLVARGKDKLEAIANDCRSAGSPDVFVCAHDLSVAEECEHAVTETVAHFKSLDVLINSAGILITGSTLTLSADDYDYIMNINTKSAFLLTKHVMPHLIQTKGNIVHVSSVTGLRAFPGIVGYNMSKAAMDQLTRSAALEVAEHGVRVNAINPGVIVTEIHKKSGMPEADYEKFLEHCRTTHALGRPGTVDEVTGTIAFLAGSEASFITGQTLAIDGGRSIMCPR